MSNRKSWRPWISSVGVVIVGSFVTGEREAASAAAAVRSALVVRPADAASSCGSQRLVGTSPARYCTSPDFERPCGASAVSRFVHVMIGTAALNGTPLVSAFQTAPPPSEMPSAPICVSEISGRAREPGEELARVLHVARAVEAEEPFGDAVAAGIALERGVAGRREVLRRDRLHVLVLAAEAVEEHDGGPAAGRRSAVGLDERAGEIGAVRGDEGQLLRGRREAPIRRTRVQRRLTQGGRTGGPRRATGYPYSTIVVWMRGPSASSTRA